MRSVNLFIIYAVLILMAGCTSPEINILPEELTVTQKFQPETYICYQCSGEITVDGKMDEVDWKNAAWTKLFVDIEGEKRAAPTYATRAKMLWDSACFYVAAELVEPHIWGTLRQRDTVIFYDNDFEIFIDPDWDTHNYYEFEMNALNTVWDLLLTKPYRDGGLAIDSWNIIGLKTGVHINGTLNDPSDIDHKWFVEVAMPLEVLKEAQAGQKVPVDGEQWRVGFSRVQRQMEHEKGGYKKKKGPAGERVPEDNWVWSATDEINMHKPELWGVVQFSQLTSDNQNAVYQQDEDWEIISQLRNLYYRQNNYRKKFGAFATAAVELRFNDFNPEIVVHKNTYSASMLSTSGQFYWFIREDGYLWKGEK
ncbi:MAG: carbohydrate-binding family 9-like protein [Bacteroidota bacterium]